MLDATVYLLDRLKLNLDSGCDPKCCCGGAEEYVPYGRGSGMMQTLYRLVQWILKDGNFHWELLSSTVLA